MNHHKLKAKIAALETIVVLLSIKGISEEQRYQLKETFHTIDKQIDKELSLSGQHSVQKGVM